MVVSCVGGVGGSSTINGKKEGLLLLFDFPEGVKGDAKEKLLSRLVS